MLTSFTLLYETPGWVYAQQLRSARSANSRVWKGQAPGRGLRRKPYHSHTSPAHGLFLHAHSFIRAQSTHPRSDIAAYDRRAVR